MAWPFDGELFEALRQDLSGEDAIHPDTDYYWPFTLYSDATTLYDMGSWAVDHRVILKRRSTDADDLYIAVGEATVSGATGEGHIYFSAAQLDIEPGRYYWSWDASNGTKWLPVMHGIAVVVNKASYAGSPPAA